MRRKVSSAKAQNHKGGVKVKHTQRNAERGMKVLRLGELFCGPGGIACGARMANEIADKTGYIIKHAWATDYDESTCRTYALQ